MQWAWGLDDTNAWNNNGPPAGATPDPVMQQATVNLFADMGVARHDADERPGRGLAVDRHDGARLDDREPLGRARRSPTDRRVTISGTATDAGGTVAGVEVSTDGGTTWHPATGTTSWSYSWIAHGSPSSTIMSRAVDDTGNVESSSPSVTRQRRLPVHDGRART